MGILRAISASFSGTLADQYKEVITVNNFDEQTLVAPGILKNSFNNNASAGTISNGSIIYVPENTAAFIFSNLGIENVITESGGFEYQDGQSSIFNGDKIGQSIFKQAKERIGFAGSTSDYKQIAYVNLREIRNIKFGTKGAQIYNDKYYGADLEIKVFGTFSIKIDDPLVFIKEYVPVGVTYYSMADVDTKAELVSEFMQSFLTALNSLSKDYRISELPSQANTIAKTILEDPENAGSWPRRFGFHITKVSIENIEFSDDSRELVRKYSENKMNLKAYEDVSQKASNIAAQQAIAEGIKNNGLGESGNMIYGMNFAQGLNVVDAQQNNSNSLMDLDKQIENVKKLKELLDAGILTQEEFDKKKKELMGL